MRNGTAFILQCQNDSIMDRRIWAKGLNFV